ncbi:LysR substrate-binding domain-containing protein [Novosphingobium sp.]|uniref:LysR substrate-binding domain-containing protein n=1 Tax=Novosphingobium sp. TaxID=1874826 RepID=UPI003BAD00D6
MRRSATLPPLPSLRAFAAVGRLLSFRKAGEELLITQSAVSHHVKQLEDYLGTALFERHGRTISLTAAGQAFLARVDAGFATIEAGVREVRGDPATVRVSLLPSFAANWLVPRLPDFRALHPEIVVELDPSLETVDLGQGTADLAIRYGAPGWPGLDAECLMREALTPVLSGTEEPLREPGDVLQHTLLLSRRETDWQMWAKACGVDFAKARTLQLVDYNLVLQAAAEGQGIAMGRLSLVRERLRNGALVAPLPVVQAQDDAAYWLLSAKGRGLPKSAAAFRQWLLGEARAFAESA